ncbi:MAG: hypothetical protein SGARI_003490, partial [Bacillariaceae sp.]
VKRQKTATRLLRGKLNDPDYPAVWSIEIALSYQDLLEHTHQTDPNFAPKPGTMLRINFSRVERQGAINWTWAPQMVWDPSNHRYSGYVAMHLPDAWGYFVFGDEGGKDEGSIPKDPTWPGRLAAMNVYYAQKVYSEQRQSELGKTKYASTLEELSNLVDDAILEPFQIDIQVTEVGYVARVTGNPDGSVVTVTQDRFLQVKPASTKMDPQVQKNQ